MANGVGFNRGETAIAGLLSGILQGATFRLQRNRQRQLDEDQRRQQEFVNTLATAREERAEAQEGREQEAFLQQDIERRRTDLAQRPLREGQQVVQEGERLKRQLPGIPPVGEGELTQRAGLERELGVLRGAKELGVTRGGVPTIPGGKFLTPEQQQAEKAKARTRVDKTINTINKGLFEPDPLKQRTYASRPKEDFETAPGAVEETVLQAEAFGGDPEDYVPLVLSVAWVDNFMKLPDIPDLITRIGAVPGETGQEVEFDAGTPFLQTSQIGDAFPEGTVFDPRIGEELSLLSIEDLAFAMAQNPDLKELAFQDFMRKILEPFARLRPIDRGVRGESRTSLQTVETPEQRGQRRLEQTVTGERRTF